MLKGIHPLLNADLLYALAAMGHGDDLVIVDANFPAESIARQTGLGHLLTVGAANATEALSAILSVYPLDGFVDDAAGTMSVVGKPDEIVPIRLEAQAIIDKAEGKSWPIIGIERFAFYERAKQAFCIVQTLEYRLYGNFALRKGVIA